MNTARARRQSRKWTALILSLSQVIFVILVLVSSRDKSFTYDEPFHVTSGYSHWVYNDYRLTPDNGNLTKRWVSLPIVFEELTLDVEQNPWWRSSNQNRLARDFVYGQRNKELRSSIVWRGRFMMALLGVLLCLTVFFLSRQRFGVWGGWISLAACMLSPTVLAHSRIMTSDLMVGLAYLWAINALWQALHNLTGKSLLLSAVATSVVCLCKFSGLLIIPVALVLGGLRIMIGRVWIVSLGRKKQRVRSRWQQCKVLLSLVLAHIVLGFLVIWLAYGFRYSMFWDSSPLNRPPPELTIPLENLGRVGPVISTFHSYHLLPESFLFGISSVIGHAQYRMAFLNGEHSMTGWGTYFPFAFLVKTSWPILLLIVLALGRSVGAFLTGSAEGRRRSLRRLYKSAPHLLFLLFYSFIAIRSSINIGHRHIFPIYPVIFVLIGSLGHWLASKTAWKRWIIVILGFGLVLESCLIYPHYLSYFNGLIRPKSAYKHLVDSNLDWGQDLPRLKQWLEGKQLNNEEGEALVSYFGFASPGFYGIRAKVFGGYHAKREAVIWGPWKPGYFCVSASIYQGVYTKATGPWTESRERQYQKLLVRMKELWRARETGDQTQLAKYERSSLLNSISLYEQFAVARMCASLRKRPPDDRIGYSILIFKLSEEDVERGLRGPPPIERG